MSLRKDSIVSKPEGQAVITSDKYHQYCLLSIERHGHSALEHIAPENRTYELYLAALKKNVCALDYLEHPIDRERLTVDEYHKLCLSAMDIYGYSALKHIAPKMRTYELYLRAFNEGKFSFIWLEKPEDRGELTLDEYHKLCLRAIEKYGYSALKLIAPSMRTYELYLAAIANNVNAFQYLQNDEDQVCLKPGEFRKLCLKGLEIYDTQVLKHITDPMQLQQTYEFQLACIQRDSGALHHLQDPANRAFLKPDEYKKLCLEAVKKHWLSAIHYINVDMRIYELYLVAVNAGNIISCFEIEVAKKNFSLEQYANLASIVIKTKYAQEFDANLSSDALKSFIARYESINKLNDYRMGDIEYFFSENISVISKIYPLLGNQIFVLMQKMLVTSGDNLKRYLEEGKELADSAFDSCSKNISRLIEGVEYKNSGKKASQLKLYLYLSNEEKAKINILLDDSSSNIETIPNEMRGFLVKRFYDHLNIPYNNKEKNAMDVFSNEQLADLYGLLVVFLRNPSKVDGKIFFAMLKLYLTNIPFQCLSQPDEMKKHGDKHLIKMAEHNKKLRDELAASGIDIKKAFSYTKQVALTFDEHHKQHILDLLAAIYKKIKESNSDKKLIKNFLSQIEKGGDKIIDDTKLLRILSDSNIKMLNEIVTLLPAINDDYLELTKLTINLDVLKNYQPRKFHIEMWDKSKMDSLFLGDYLSCCLATTGSKNSRYAPRVFDDAFLMPVVIDEATKKPVCGAWLFLADVTYSSSSITKDTVANYFEINSGIAENEALMNYLVVNLLNYIGQFSKSIGAFDFLMRPLTYGKIPNFDDFGAFTLEYVRNVNKVGGYFGGKKYYLNAVSEQYFYQFDSARFSAKMQKLIVPEPKVLEYASQMTLGFAAKPSSASSASSADAQPTQEPSQSNLINNH